MKRHTIGKEVITLGESKMPHIRLPENLGIRYAVLPGDPARAERAAGYLKDFPEAGYAAFYFLPMLSLS